METSSYFFFRGFPACWLLGKWDKCGQVGKVPCQKMVLDSEGLDGPAFYSPNLGAIAKFTPNSTSLHLSRETKLGRQDTSD